MSLEILSISRPYTCNAFDESAEGIWVDPDTYSSLLKKCKSFSLGKHIHAHIIKSKSMGDRYVENHLMQMYGGCGAVDDACILFARISNRNIFSWNIMLAIYFKLQKVGDAYALFIRMPERDLVSWNSMIAGYAQQGLGIQAIRLFHKMQLEGIKPDKVSIISVFSGCACNATLEEGQKVHELIDNSISMSDVVIGTSLINMYHKCGSLDHAWTIFNEIPEKNVATWNAMIGGYAQQGYIEKALHLFQLMHLEGMRPSSLTLTNILSACCHVGLPDDGTFYFICMSLDYQIAPTIEHFNCVADILGRVGWLEEAENVLISMIHEPTVRPWMALLGACSRLMDIERGKRAAEHVVELAPENLAPYVVLSNIYAAAGLWADVRNIRKIMKQKRLKSLKTNLHKFDKVMHEFCCHQLTAKAYNEVQMLISEMYVEGFSI